MALTLFAFIERAAASKALVPREVMKNELFLAACIAVLLMSAIFFASLLYLPQFMTKVLGYSALRSGAGLLPLMGVFALTSFTAGPLYTRLRPKVIVSLGAAFLALGIFMLSASVFGVLLEHPMSWLHQSIENGVVRRGLMGLAMGATAVSIILSPWGQRSGAHTLCKTEHRCFPLECMKVRSTTFRTSAPCAG